MYSNDLLNCNIHNMIILNIKINFYVLYCCNMYNMV